MKKAFIPEDLRGPGWQRMPKPFERLEGLSKTTIFEQVKLGHIKSAHVKAPGAVRGIRLIWMPSLYAWLDSISETQTPDPESLRQVSERIKEVRALWKAASAEQRAQWLGELPPTSRK